MQAQPAQAQALSDAQKAEVNKMIAEYLQANGEEIITSVETYQNNLDAEERQRAEVKAEAFLDELEKENNLPMTGNPKGDLTLVEFFDFNCGYCTKALEEIVTVLEDDKEIKVVFMDMPILGPNSLEASKWAMAAHEQGKYFEFHQDLLHHQGPKDEAAMTKIAEKIGLDVKKLKTDKDSKKIASLLDNNIDKARSLNIQGTPGFIINGRIFPGYMPADRIKEIIKEERLTQTPKG